MPPNKNSLAIDSELLHQARNLDIDAAFTESDRDEMLPRWIVLN